STLVWFDGEVHSDEAPLLSGLDRGLTVGDGVFDTCVVVSGRPFALRRHLDRLGRSAARVGLPAPPTELITGVAQDLAARLEGGTGRLRVTWTAGVPRTGLTREAGPATLLLTASQQAVAHPCPQGAVTPSRTAVVLVPWVRNERSRWSG